MRSLNIGHPVGRSGARFEALVSRDSLCGLDTTRLRFFVVEDDDGKRYPAMIEQVSPVEGNEQLARLCGVVVAGGS
jgi:hypothetical protein